ncbi:NADP-dependent oxidoreductase domain-containing protein [Aspergillus pseudocaelatus]|uniref:NADP-dependent oxidoreductase domain-containing protein n=1 Tax=Aspergillus pseudocaelatus TaxID=1825620 RepID=A0ABQ6W285_9EURO|nr:NADP-dependent oxidoreductase domain-containing protein [Aspergillus pseudocaelatus]
MTTPSAPHSTLRRHRLLAPSAAVLNSPICLGSMAFGDAWKSGLLECSKATTFQILDHFYEMGGNFIDTFAESETWIGEWMKDSPNRRDKMVISSKYAEDWKTYSGPELIQKLQTTYIDLLYVHFWDYISTAEEMMISLNVLVNQGKVLYLGICNTPAWVVVKCNEFARRHGMRPFSVYQGWRSAADRDLERDILPICKAEGIAVARWGLLRGGYFKPHHHQPPRVGDHGRTTQSLTVGREARVSLSLEKIAKPRDLPLTSIALAYVSQLQSNIEALKIALSKEEIATIDQADEFDVGFRHNLMSGLKPHGREDKLLAKIRGPFDFLEAAKPILTVSYFLRLFVGENLGRWPRWGIGGWQWKNCHR